MDGPDRLEEIHMRDQILNVFYHWEGCLDFEKLRKEGHNFPEQEQDQGERQILRATCLVEDCGYWAGMLNKWLIDAAIVSHDGFSPIGCEEIVSKNGSSNGTNRGNIPA